MSVYNLSNLNRNPKIPSSSNTYIPVCFEDKENVFEVVNMSLNGSSRQEQGKVPRLEISRTRSFSRQSSPNSSFRTQTENEANNSMLHYTNQLQQHLNTQGSSITRDYIKKQIPIPKPQNLPQAPSSRSNYSVKDIVNGTQNNLYNYAYQPQRTKRSLSGQLYSSPSYENVENKQYFPDYSLEYSCNFSSNGGNYALPQDSILNESRAVISKETDAYVQEYKEKMKELNKFFDENKAFEQEVQTNLKNLQYLGQRKQDIILDCIKDLDDLYLKYQKQSNYHDDANNQEVEITDASTQNYITQQKNQISSQDIINCHSSQYDFSDFQDRKSVQIIEGDYSLSYKSQSQCDVINQPSVNDFDS